MKKWYFIQLGKVLNGDFFATSNVVWCLESELGNHVKALPTPNHSGRRGDLSVFELAPDGDKKSRPDLDKLPV